MRKLITYSTGMIAAFAAGIVIGSQQVADGHVVTPAKISKAETEGLVFERPETVETTRGDNRILDVTTLKSSDGKFASGMYRAGKSHRKLDKPWGVDEFMFFVEGGVTLTSADGSVQVIGPGEGVTIPKEWTGVWETDGYTKIWVIYSQDGSGI